MKEKDYREGTAEKSALESLTKRYKEFKNGDITCDKFSVFYNAHLTNYCN